MATVRQCDRCGNFYKAKADNKYIKTHPSNDSGYLLYMDLCNECCADLRAFLIHAVDIVKEEVAKND